MKKHALAAALVLAMAVAAEAQITVTYTRQTSNSRLTVRFTGASYSSYGYGGYGFGGGGGYGYAYGGYGAYLGSFRHAVAPGVVAGAYHPGLVGYGYGYGYPGYARYGAPFRPIMDYHPGPAAARQVPERTPENVAAALIDQARKRLKVGDYRGAVDDIRSAVVEDEAGGTSEAWFGVALAIAGDGRNADKALRSALAHGFKGLLDLQLRDKKEEGRVVGLLSKASGEGAAAAAYGLSLLGHPEKLQKLAEKDASLKPLLLQEK